MKKLDSYGDMFKKSAGSRILRSLVLMTSIASLALTGCDSQSKAIFNFECPEKKLVQLDLLDLSSSGRASDVLDERLKSIQIDVERVTDCEGEFSLVAWSASSASSYEIFQGTLKTAGATEIGRDRKISNAVSQTMAEIRSGLTDAFERVNPVGSNLFGAFSIAEDQLKTLGPNDELEIVIYSDAITNVSQHSVNQAGLTEEQAIKSAQIASGIELVDIRVSIIGVGKTGNKISQPPQGYVLMLRIYAEEMCRITKGVCTILTV